MTFKLAALLNPAPASGPSSPKPLAEDLGSLSKTERINDQDDGLEAATALTSLAVAAPHDAVNFPPLLTPSSPISLPTIETSHSQRRQSSIHIAPLEPSPTLPEQHSSSPTLEQYHHGSKSPEQRRRSEVDHPLSLSPTHRLPPLQVVTGAVREQLQLHGATPQAPSLPLFVPAKPQPKLDRKASVPTQPCTTSPPPTGGSPETPIDQTMLDDVHDPATRAAILAAANEHSLRGSRKTSEPKSAVDTVIPKKRAAAKATAANKKGVSKKQPPSKKRKTDHEVSARNSTRSATPSLRGSGGGTKASAKSRKSSTPAIEGSPPVGDEAQSDDEDDASDQDDELYCICRKPDDHKYMIACDGCDDWFHGKCVNIREDQGKLIGKFFCPGCEEKGKGETTWKLMCRRPTCSNPASVQANGERSKYCSKECGVRFFSDLVAKSTSEQQKLKGRRKAIDGDAGDPILHNSGPLSAGQIKALATKSKDSATFRSLGNGVLDPVTSGLTESYNAGNTTRTKSESKTNVEEFYTLTDEEKTSLDQIKQEKERLFTARVVLKEREGFLAMAKARLAAYAVREKLKPKEVCGFDSRLSWNQTRFSAWRNSSAGTTAFNRNSLDIPPSSTALNGTATIEELLTATGATNANADASNDDSNLPNDGMCQRKRCERHKLWQKLQLDEVRFEENGLANQMRELDRQEREVKDLALTRWRKEANGMLSRKVGGMTINGTMS